MSRKTDLKDLTVLIPLRLDSIDRIENLQLVIDFHLRHANTSIHILEAARFNNGILRKILPRQVQFEFVEDFDPIFYRTRYINRMVLTVNTPYCAVWDVDVLAPHQQLVETVQLLRRGDADFVYPYRDLIYDVPEIIKEHYRETGSINILTGNTGKMEKMYLPNPVGGAFVVNRQAYIESGLENENFYGWGREDGERINRWNILGYSVKRVQGPLFHLTHSRGINSRFHDTRQDDIKINEIYRTGSMSRKELKREIGTWQTNTGTTTSKF